MKETLVIGASTNPDRYSYKAIQMLIERHHVVRAIGINEGSIFGVEINKKQILWKHIDTVTLYINKEIQESYINYIIKLAPRRVIFNPGTENPNFCSLLQKNNINYDEACTLVLLSTNQY